ncbi:TetR family transcriptional regulator [Streptomyces canus]|uniref:TetR/AcrR family transcriptional regulator n=1 Tax=Streptomyces canus TaxID=58343 RepID=UPI002E2B1567|nr:TetR family transcriptional regulator [Streptomyces canus]
MNVDRPEESGRREQNKQRTRDALLRSAARLFQDKGYEETTVRDIAQDAGVGERTFFRYFPAKESLLLHQMRDRIPLLADEIAVRPADEPPLLALRNTVIELIGRDDIRASFLVGRQPMPVTPKTLGERFLLFEVEEAVAAAFLTRATAPDADPQDPEHQLRASILARAGVGVLRALRLAYTQLPEPARQDVDMTAYIHAGFETLLAGGLGQSVA